MLNGTAEKEDPANPDYGLDYGSTLHRATRATKKTRKDSKNKSEEKSRRKMKNSGKSSSSSRLQPRGSGSVGSNSAGSGSKSSSNRSSGRRNSVKSLKKEIRNINTKFETHEFWPWHIHITAYSSDFPTECSGMLLGRVLFISMTHTV